MTDAVDTPEDGTGKRPTLRVQRVTWPWASVLAGMFGIAFFVVVTDPRLAAFYDLPAGLLRDDVRYAVLGAMVLIVLFDLRRYRHQRLHQAHDVDRMRAQLDDLWQRNRQLQLKAHTYSDHADKLKLFISDKLLEYIEYDEKFLHFKGIAAEVRHNGVISFDKVQSALQLAAADAESAAASGRAGQYRAALDAMRYLWDLLDLSTAENLTLHIGNLLCECEEHYCQRLLHDDETAALPFEPTFAPQRAAWRALGMIRQDTLAELEPETGEAEPWLLHDRALYARLEPVAELLGNENHLVLLLENLLRNAQFYAGKRGYSAPFAPIALTLTESNGHVGIRVYNRGPHIRAEDRPNLFQLGYSTRRKRDDHGRGLGLYFVNEIVKAYEGRINVDNIHTPAEPYDVVLELANGEVVSKRVDVVLEQGRPRCVLATGATGTHYEWKLPAGVQRVLVSTAAEACAACIDDLAPRGRQERHDPAHPSCPRWRVRYQPGRMGARITFEPMAIHGVEFEIRLPSARERLDSAEPETAAEPMAATMERFDEQVRERVVPAPEH